MPHGHTRAPGPSASVSAAADAARSAPAGADDSARRQHAAGADHAARAPWLADTAGAAFREENGRIRVPMEGLWRLTAVEEQCQGGGGRQDGRAKFEGRTDHFSILLGRGENVPS